VKRITLVGLVLLLIGIFLTEAGPVAAATEGRPIEDFISAQGTYCIDDGMGGCFLLVPPIANFIGWIDPAKEIRASVDYAGLANEFAAGAFGTQMTGSMTERPLADGRAEVHINLQTTNALSWVVDGLNLANDPLLFGHRASDVLNEGAEAALGESLLRVDFINTAPGAPLPDVIQLIVDPEQGQELRLLSFYARADGPLADGTPGRLEVVQTGLYMKEEFGGAVADHYPVENIILRAVGQ
jgi:hypothetical protein